MRFACMLCFAASYAALPGFAGSLGFLSNTQQSTIDVISTAQGQQLAAIPFPTYRASSEAVSPDGSTVYVAGEHGVISVVDTRTNRITRTFPGSAPGSYMALSSDGSTLYVTNKSTSKIYAIEASTGSVAASYPFAKGGFGGIALSGDGKRFYTLWVQPQPATGFGSEVYVVDIKSKQTLQSVLVNATGPLAISPDEKTAYVSSLNVNNPSLLLVVNLTTAQVTRKLTFPSEHLVLSSQGDRLYGGSGDNLPFRNQVGVLNTSTLQIDVTDLPGQVGPLALSADGSRLYAVYTTAQSQFAVIDTASNTIVSNIPLACIPIASVLSPDGATLYVANGPACLVDTFDSATAKLTGSFEVPGPQSITVLPNASRLYISTVLANLWVLDARTFQKLAVITPPCCLTGAYPVPSPDSSRLYLEENSSILIYDTATNETIGSVPLPASQGQMALSRDGARLFVGSSAYGTVSVVDTALRMVVATIDLPDIYYVTDIAANPTLDYIYAIGYSMSASAQAVVVIDSRTFQILTTLALPQLKGLDPSLTVAPDGASIWATGQGVYEIDAFTNQVGGFVQVGDAANSSVASPAAVSPDGSRVYVVAGDSNLDTVAIDTRTLSVVGKIPVAAYDVAMRGF